MALRDSTKGIFADALIEMMGHIPLEKVRVEELCRRCGSNRRSFYYHFKDKYDLVAWIFFRDYESSMAETGGEYTLEHVVKTLERLKDKEAFYRNAFADRSQNTISGYIFEMFVELGSERVKKCLGCEELSQEELYDIKSHSYATIGHTLEWINGKTFYTPREFARLQYRSMPEILKRAYGISKEEGSSSL